MVELLAVDDRRKVLLSIFNSSDFAVATNFVPIVWIVHTGFAAERHRQRTTKELN